MEPASCQLFGAQNFVVPPKVLENLCNPVLSYSQNLAEGSVYLSSFPLIKH